MKAALRAWRVAERQRLLRLRRAITPGERRELASEVVAELERLLPAPARRVISVYWPIRGELDLRAWMQARHQRGDTVVLPVVPEPQAPMRFRQWQPDAAMTRGIWNIPVPAAGPWLTPDVVLAPLLGFDAAGYRLGNGGGYFDRTLATLEPQPLVIGVGHVSGRLESISPQPHDIPMDIIITGRGQVFHRDAEG